MFICPILRSRKMKIIVSSAIFANLFKNYFRVEKYGGFLLNCTKVSSTDGLTEFLNSQHCK